jgi:hypothetical protein
LLLRLDRRADAAVVLKESLTINPDNYECHRNLISALTLRDEPSIAAHFDALADEFPKSSTPMRLALEYLTG